LNITSSLSMESHSWKC